MHKHDITSHADMNEKHWDKFLANVPQDLRPNVIEKFCTYSEMTHKDRHWWNLINRGYWLRDYPVVYDPEQKAKAEYWKTATAELCEYLEGRTEIFQQEDINTKSYHQFYNKFSLTDAQKTRLLDGEPLYVNPKLGVFYDNSILYYQSSWNFPLRSAQAFMFESRDEELALLKVAETPELENMKLTVGDIVRWDGSTSLQPVARIVAAHSAEIPWKWRPPRGEETSDIVFMDQYDWIFDDEIGGFDPFWVNRRLSKEQSYDAHAQPLPLEEEPPNARFLSYFKFGQTHQAYVNLIEGSRDLMFATRMPSEDELALMKRKNVELEYYPFAKDAFVFIGNRNNPVRDLTLEQVRSIFSGKTTKWKKVGGFGGTIHPLIRDKNSGSEELMRELVMKNIRVSDKFKHQLVGAMYGIFDELEKNIEGIGYSILYYERYMVRSPYTRTIRINGIEPTPQTVADGTYPLLYECVAVVRKDSPEKAKAVAKWLTGDEGAKVIRESGYVPINNHKHADDAD